MEIVWFLVALTIILLCCAALAALAVFCSHFLRLSIALEPDLPEEVREMLLDAGLLSLYQVCERLKHQTQPLVLDEIIRPERPLARSNHACIAQDAQMMRDCGLLKVEAGHNIIDADLAPVCYEQRNDAQAGWVCDGFQVAGLAFSLVFRETWRRCRFWRGWKIAFAYGRIVQGRDH